MDAMEGAGSGDDAIEGVGRAPGGARAQAAADALTEGAPTKGAPTKDASRNGVMTKDALTEGARTEDVVTRGASHHRRTRAGAVSAKPLVYAQLAAFALLAVLALAGLFVDMRFAVGFLALAMQLLVLFAIPFWPLRGTAIDRVVGIIGAETMILGTQLLLRRLPASGGVSGPQGSQTPSGGSDATDTASFLHICTLWAGMLIAVLAAFVVLGFLRQMLRRERTDMVLSLAQSLLVDVASVAAAGWLFLPVALRSVSGGGLGSKATGIAVVATIWVVMIAALALMVALSMASLRWWRDITAQPLPGSASQASNGQDRVMNTGVVTNPAGPESGADGLGRRYGWMSIGLSSVMLSGLVVFLAAVGLAVFIG